MMPFNFGNSMIDAVLDAAQCNKKVGAAAEDELNQQFHSSEKWVQKENEQSSNLNSLISENENKKMFIEQNKTIEKESEISELQHYEQLINSSDNYITTSTSDLPKSKNIEISFNSSISNINQRPPKTATTLSKSKLNYSDLVRNSTDFLRNIISSLQAEEDPYDISDWEDEEAMKPMELDLDAEIFNGKKIPSWACGKQLAAAVSKQNQNDGDRIFQDLPRRVNIVALFETNVFPYYQQRFR